MRTLPLALVIGGCAAAPEPTPTPDPGTVCAAEAAADDVPLAVDAAAFAARFDANVSVPRLVFLGEPFCGPCQSNARRLDDLYQAWDEPRLRADVVWTPAWDLQNEEGMARDQTPTNRDDRERVWFDEDAALSFAISDKVPGDAPVYDLLMLWAPGRTWGEDGDDTLPAPDAVWTPGWTIEPIIEAASALVPDCDRVGPL